MRNLIKTKVHDNGAKEAVELICYQTKKWIGSFSAALEGLNVLVFSGALGNILPK